MSPSKPPDKHRPGRWNLLKSFSCALAGLWLCLRRERNFRIHVVALGYVLWLAGALGVSPECWALLLLASGLVLSCELFNSSLELIVDSLTGEYRIFAHFAKDVGAGAVLVASVFAVGVGFFTLYRPEELLALAKSLLGSPLQMALAALSLAASLLFVFLPGVWEGDAHLGQGTPDSGDAEGNEQLTP